VRFELALVIDHLSLKTRIGDVWLGATPRGLFWANLGPIDAQAVEDFFSSRQDVVFRSGGAVVEQAARELLRYLEAKQKRLSVKIDLRGSRPFSRRVWMATRKIPYGDVRSYVWVADRLGDPRSAGAVGGALARNPLPIFIPCHRVVGSHGGLGGFSAGLSLKRWLLNLESGQPSLELESQGVEGT
jgi:methylated-DNA-[protein]-cysteine S-methyltransferase